MNHESQDNNWENELVHTNTVLEKINIKDISCIRRLWYTKCILYIEIYHTKCNLYRVCSIIDGSVFQIRCTRTLWFGKGSTKAIIGYFKVLI